jgi:hypothetical protein
MDNNLHDTIARLKQNGPTLEVGSDFENQVFAKIKKKKRQRKITTSITAGIAIFGFLFIAQATFLKPDKSKSLRMANQLKQRTMEKEEVPVVEDVVFASSDSTANYVIEQVNYTSDDSSI